MNDYLNYKGDAQMKIAILEELREIKSLLTKKVSNRWITLNELCDFVSLSPSTCRRAINRGELKVSRKTGKLLFNIEDVKRWLNG